MATLALCCAAASAAEPLITPPSVVTEALPIPDAPDSGAGVEPMEPMERMEPMTTVQRAPFTGCQKAHAVQRSVPQIRGSLSRWWRYRVIPCLRDSHWGYAEYFHERPFGTLVREPLQVQISNGLARQMVLYRYDFLDGPGLASAQLNARGREQLRKLARMSLDMGFPITIEPTGDDAQMDNARRHAVLSELELQGIVPSPGMVVVAKPRAFGLGGKEAEVMFLNQMEMTQERGLGSLEGSGGQSAAPVAGPGEQ
jgi:hypothetical protein